MLLAIEFQGILPGLEWVELAFTFNRLRDFDVLQKGIDTI